MADPGLTTLTSESSMTSERFKNCELEITTSCDMQCFGCDRFLNVGQAPSMTIEQISHFVQESLDLNWAWDRIHILGGEPTLHPQLRPILRILLQYRSKFPNTMLRVISNGSGHLAQHKQWILNHGVLLNVESKSKTHNPAWFRNITFSPTDERGNLDPVPPCSIFGIPGCGIGVTRHGMFLCGAGAGVARIAGLDIGIMHLQDLTYEACLKQADEICKYCGHWDAEHRANLVTQTGHIMSPFWQEAVRKYKENPPQLSIYGAPS